MRIRSAATVAVLATVTFVPASALASSGAGTQGRTTTLRAVYTFVSKFADTAGVQCLDADFFGGGNRTRVQVWTCNGSPQQQWIERSGNPASSLESVRFRGMCLDADFFGGGNATVVQLWTCNGTLQQMWRRKPLPDLSTYSELFPTMVLDRDISVQGNGAKVQLWSKNFQVQQNWDANLIRFE
ncbi:hypothetical protein GCM10022224_103690 [Nonomuraea antimicrobica]|uniref:Ricin B lectin domain-containing protein n=1 Tax=Nonomuraea antimicrobica TaxID=561173 RepID=A0ABP7EMB1_9ACTN